MTATAKQLYAASPGTASATFYTVPASTTTILKNIILTNTTATAAVVSVQVNGLDIVSGYTVQPKDTVTFDSVLPMPAGQAITGSQVTANAINVFIGGVEMS